MLRGIVTGIGALCAVGGLTALIAGEVPSGVVALIWGAVLIGGTLFERVRYKRLESARPGPGWQPTDERFVDDATGSTVTVYIEPATGERAYVRE